MKAQPSKTEHSISSDIEPAIDQHEGLESRQSEASDARNNLKQDLNESDDDSSGLSTTSDPESDRLSVEHNDEDHESEASQTREVADRYGERSPVNIYTKSDLSLEENNRVPEPDLGKKQALATPTDIDQTLPSSDQSRVDIDSEKGLLDIKTERSHGDLLTSCQLQPVSTASEVPSELLSVLEKREDFNVKSSLEDFGTPDYPRLPPDGHEFPENIGDYNLIECTRPSDSVPPPVAFDDNMESKIVTTIPGFASSRFGSDPVVDVRKDKVEIHAHGIPGQKTFYPAAPRPVGKKRLGAADAEKVKRKIETKETENEGRSAEKPVDLLQSGDASSDEFKPPLPKSSIPDIVPIIYSHSGENLESESLSLKSNAPMDASQGNTEASSVQLQSQISVTDSVFDGYDSLDRKLLSSPRSNNSDSGSRKSSISSDSESVTSDYTKKSYAPPLQSTRKESLVDTLEKKRRESLGSGMRLKGLQIPSRRSSSGSSPVKGLPTLVKPGKSLPVVGKNKPSSFLVQHGIKPPTLKKPDASKVSNVSKIRLQMEAQSYTNSQDLITPKSYKPMTWADTQVQEVDEDERAESGTEGNSTLSHVNTSGLEKTHVSEGPVTPQVAPPPEVELAYVKKQIEVKSESVRSSSPTNPSPAPRPTPVPKPRRSTSTEQEPPVAQVQDQENMVEIMVKSPPATLPKPRSNPKPDIPTKPDLPPKPKSRTSSTASDASSRTSSGLTSPRRPDDEYITTEELKEMSLSIVQKIISDSSAEIMKSSETDEPDSSPDVSTQPAASPVPEVARQPRYSLQFSRPLRQGPKPFSSAVSGSINPISFSTRDVTPLKEETTKQVLEEKNEEEPLSTNEQTDESDIVAPPAQYDDTSDGNVQVEEEEVYVAREEQTLSSPTRNQEENDTSLHLELDTGVMEDSDASTVIEVAPPVAFSSYPPPQETPEEETDVAPELPGIPPPTLPPSSPPPQPVPSLAADVSMDRVEEYMIKETETLTLISSSRIDTAYDSHDAHTARHQPEEVPDAPVEFQDTHISNIKEEAKEQSIIRGSQPVETPRVPASLSPAGCPRIRPLDLEDLSEGRGSILSSPDVAMMSPSPTPSDADSGIDTIKIETAKLEKGNLTSDSLV